MSAPTLGSVLLASTDPQRLSAWYREAFATQVDIDGFLQFGGVALLIDMRDDIGLQAVEPGRMILNFHVDDAQAAAAHLTRLGVTWLAPFEAREDGWFAAFTDPDGNIIQIIELSPDYLERHRQNLQRDNG